MITSFWTAMVPVAAIGIGVYFYGKYNDDGNFEAGEDARMQILTSTPVLILCAVLGVFCLLLMFRDSLLWVIGSKTDAHLSDTREYACGKYGQHTCNDARYSFVYDGRSYQTKWYKYMEVAPPIEQVRFFALIPEVNKLSESILYARPDPLRTKTAKP
jgi:hypothetical protein